MKKRGILLLLTLALLLCFSLSAMALSAPVTPLDVGNNNDYGGGGGGGWDSGGWDSGNDYYYSDSGSSSDAGPIEIIGAIVIVGIIVAIAVFGKKKGSATGGNSQQMGGAPAQHPDDHTSQIMQAILPVDSNFSDERFTAWSKEVFITLQQAWTARDWSKIRPFEKEELYRQHQQQLQEYINNKQINVVERIGIKQAYLHFYQRDRQFEYLTVYMETRMNDYVIDDTTRQVVKGDPNREFHTNYFLTFMRKTGVKTDPAKSNKSTVSCPHCGAPVQCTSAGQCEYCGFIITTGEHDWVLSDLSAVRAETQVDNRGVVLYDAQPTDTNDQNPPQEGGQDDQNR